MAGAVLGVEALVGVVCDFLEAAIHALLYARELYPRSAFEPRRKYGTATQMCRHPDVCLYLRGFLADAQPWLLKGFVPSISVTVTRPDGTPLERLRVRARVPLAAAGEPNRWVLSEPARSGGSPARLPRAHPSTGADNGRPAGA
jgi:mitotic spindle assembly checkpoint protein MAD2B